MLDLRKVAAAVAVAFAVGGCSVSGTTDLDDSSLTIINDSDYVISEVHLAPVDSRSWGPNLVPDELFPGEELVITNIACDLYDVLVVDEFGVDCVLAEIDLCFTDDVWVITNATLDICAFSPVAPPES
jgi:hypothetical protein